MTAARGFEDLRVGERFALPSRTVTEAHFSLFQALSADNHPIHYDAEYCRARGYPAPLAHGLQICALPRPAREPSPMRSAMRSWALSSNRRNS